MCNYKTLAILVLNLLLISGAATLPSACNTAGIGHIADRLSRLAVS